MKRQKNETESPSDDPILPEVYTATVACICIIDGKCNGMLTPELNILLRGFEKAKYSGLHDNIHPPPMMSLASELVGLITRNDTATFRHAGQKIKNSFSRMLPSHIITALQKWA